MKIHYITFGCKVNLCETEAIKSECLNRGFETTDDEHLADVFIVNSCTVTSTSDKKVRQTLNTLRKNYPNAIIILTGCYPQAYRERVELMPSVDIVTGTKDRCSIVTLLEDYIKNHRRIVSVKEHHSSERFEITQVGEFRSKTRGFVKIQDGCNRFCTYCIIPYARGRLRSKPLEDIKKEVECLVSSGHREIVLVGINLMFYGIEHGYRLVDAVEQCARIIGVERIRLSSLEPEIITSDDLTRLSRIKQFCPQFHLSLQSGCNKTLRDMNRAYTTSDYYKLVTSIRTIFPDSSITTDIMVGFPNESEDDFKQSLKFVEKMGFARIHIFPYSRRSGTVADTMDNQLTKFEKHERVKQMSIVAHRLQENFLRSQIGKIVPVLFELENESAYYHGYTPNYTLVKVPRESTENSLRKSIFYVKIESYHENYCIGSIVK